MILSFLAILAYLISTFLLARYLVTDKAQYEHKKITNMLIVFAIFVHALSFSSFFTASGIYFGLANSASFVAWLIVVLLVISSFANPLQVLGILVYPLAAMSVALSIISPDINNKIVPFDIALHATLSITAYALLALSMCQSIILKMQENYLHKHKINNFINKLPALQTMEELLFKSLMVGFCFLTLSLITGAVFVDDFFKQHLMHKTTLSFVAWLIFAVLVFGIKLFGWRGKQVIIAVQIGFVILVISYFGSKFVLERLLA